MFSWHLQKWWARASMQTTPSSLGIYARGAYLWVVVAAMCHSHTAHSKRAEAEEMTESAGKRWRCTDTHSSRHEACDLQMRTYYINSSGLEDVLFQPAIHIRFICKSPSIGLPFVCPILHLLHAVCAMQNKASNETKKCNWMHTSTTCTFYISVSFCYFRPHCSTSFHFACILHFSFLFHLPFRLINTTTFCLSISLSLPFNLSHAHKLIHSEHTFHNFT